MRSIIVGLLVVSMISGAWAAPAPSTSSSKAPAAKTAGKAVKPLPPPVCKPGAPVGVNAALDQGVAHVVVDFASAVEGARVSVRGTDGLTVHGNPVPRSGRFAAGAVERFDVGYTSVPGGYLVVTVEGDFGGQHSSRVTSFRVSGGTAAKQGTVTKTPAGTIQVLPGETTIKR